MSSSPAGAADAQGGLEVEQQPRPLQAVPDGRAVGLERVVGPIAVELEVDRPVRAEVLGQPAVVRRCELEHQAGQPGRPPVPDAVAGDVADREHRLERVHRGVEAAVGRGGGPGPVPLVDDAAEVVVPEVFLEDLRRLGEQVVGARQARDDGGRAGEHHERVGVAGLGVVGLAVRTDLAEPAAVLGVAEHAAQAVEGPRGGRGGSVDAQQRADPVDVDGAARDPGVHGTAEVGRAVVVEPRGTAARVHDAPAEVEQAPALGVEPGVVRAAASWREASSIRAVKQSRPTTHETPAHRAGVSRLDYVQWQVEDSNLCRQCRLIYSQLPLAARATCRAVRNNSKARTSPRIAGARCGEPHDEPLRRHNHG